jgi:hypothetical protein
MFLLLSSPDHEYFRAGEIIAAVGDHYLIQFDGDDPPPPMELALFTTYATSFCSSFGKELWSRST